MKFAKVVFWVAGIFGLLVVTPLYFMFDLIGRRDPPAITHPGFFYGFAGLSRWEKCGSGGIRNEVGETA